MSKARGVKALIAFLVVALSIYMMIMTPNYEPIDVTGWVASYLKSTWMTIIKKIKKQNM